MTVDKPHTDIAFFLSHGFVVIAPNYRGSTGYGQEYQESVKGMTFIKGAEDVYAAAQYIRQQPYVLKERMILRGGSFGSNVNSNLLADILTKKFEPIFAGVHLSGGLYYPCDIHKDTPVFISHGLKDETCSPAVAMLFMKRLLSSGRQKTQTFIAKHGDHHLIDQELQSGETEKEAFVELYNFLQHTANFAFDPSGNGDFKFAEKDQQLINLTRLCASDPVLDLTDEDILKDLERERRVAQIIEDQVTFVHPNLTREIPVQPSLLPVTLGKLNGPTMSYFRLVLGESFVPNIQGAWKLFLENHYPIMDRLSNRQGEPEILIADAGRDMLADTSFMEKIFSATAHEEDYLAKHPEKMVLYHAAHEDSLQSYLTITLFSCFLNGVPADKISVMRFLDCYSLWYSNIESFLLMMRQRRAFLDPERKTRMNFLQGYQRAALAFNFALAGNHYYTASNTLWWFFKKTITSKTTVNQSPVKFILYEILNLLGVYSEARVNRYVELFKKEQGRSKAEGEAPAVLQQVFVDRDTEDAYVCDIWGEEFTGPEGREISKLSTISRLIENPLEMEAYLAKRGAAFTNPSGVLRYPGKHDNALYTQVLQVRGILKPGTYECFSYLRNPNALGRLMGSLLALIKEDITCFILSNTEIPKEIKGTNHLFIEDLRKNAGVQHDRYVVPKYVESLLANNNLRARLCHNPDLTAKICASFLGLSYRHEAFVPLMNQIAQTSEEKLVRIYGSMYLQHIFSGCDTSGYMMVFESCVNANEEELEHLKF